MVAILGAAAEQAVVGQAVPKHACLHHNLGVDGLVWLAQLGQPPEQQPMGCQHYAGDG